MADQEQVGVDYLITVDIAGTPTLIGGQKNASVDWEWDTIDVSNKTHGKVKLPGGGGFTISLEGILFDSNAGADALEAAFFARTTVLVDMRKGVAIRYEGEGTLTKKSLKAPYEGGAEWSYTLEGRGQFAPPA